MALERPADPHRHERGCGHGCGGTHCCGESHEHVRGEWPKLEWALGRLALAGVSFSVLDVRGSILADVVAVEVTDEGHVRTGSGGWLSLSTIQFLCWDPTQTRLSREFQMQRRRGLHPRTGGEQAIAARPSRQPALARERAIRAEHWARVREAFPLLTREQLDEIATAQAVPPSVREMGYSIEEVALAALPAPHAAGDAAAGALGDDQRRPAGLEIRPPLMWDGAPMTAENWAELMNTRMSARGPASQNDDVDWNPDDEMDWAAEISSAPEDDERD